jgi:RNA polymerase sigma-70 factor (ECF subfamily)
VRLALEKRIADRWEDKDRPLVDRAQAGDREAVGELFVRHAQAVRRLLAGVIGSANELDDLVQDVFIQVFKSLPSFRGDARFSTWLHQVTMYAAYNHLRRPRRVTLAEPDELAVAGDVAEDGPQARLCGRETMRRLNAILDTIKPKKRIAFILFAVEGYSIGEVSEMVGAPIPTVKSRVWFARRELRKKARRDPYLGQVLADLEVGDDG